MRTGVLFQICAHCTIFFFVQDRTVTSQLSDMLFKSMYHVYESFNSIKYEDPAEADSLHLHAQSLAFMR
jgi:hypothetical protein